jgi:hypothetical protein
MEGLFTIIMLMLLFAASNWLKRRAEPEESEQWPDEIEPGDQPPDHRRTAAPGEPGARPVRSSWEEELRRLLEGESRRPEPKPTPPAPPPIRPAVVTPSRPVPAPPSLPPVTAGTPHGKVQTIGQTALLLGRTRELQRRATDELRRAKAQIGGRPIVSPQERRHDQSEEIRQARGWFRNPQAARQAVIASVILGPPRALTSSDDLPGLTSRER